MAKTAMKQTVNVEVIKVTPKKAREWLETNEVNRSVRPKVIAAYRRDMEAGRWSFTAEPIQISRTGRLLNGQHRLAALAEAKGVRQLELVVATGLPDETQAMMDQGVARTVSDALRIQGKVKNVTVVASIARWMHLAPELGPSLTQSTLRQKVTTAEALTALELNDDINYAAERAVFFRNYIDGSPSAVGYTFLHMNRANPEACAEFWAGMIDMDWAWKHDPRKAALRRMQVIHKEQETRANQETAIISVSVFSRAWNAWRKGEELESIAIRSRSGVIPPVHLIP